MSERPLWRNGSRVIFIRTFRFLGQVDRGIRLDVDRRVGEINHGSYGQSHDLSATAQDPGEDKENGG